MRLTFWNQPRQQFVNYSNYLLVSLISCNFIKLTFYENYILHAPLSCFYRVIVGAVNLTLIDQLILHNFVYLSSSITSQNITDKFTCRLIIGGVPHSPYRRHSPCCALYLIPIQLWLDFNGWYEDFMDSIFYQTLVWWQTNWKTKGRLSSLDNDFFNALSKMLQAKIFPMG